MISHSPNGLFPSAGCAPKQAFLFCSQKEALLCGHHVYVWSGLVTDFWQPAVIMGCEACLDGSKRRMRLRWQHEEEPLRPKLHRFCLVPDGSTISYDVLMRELWLHVEETRAISQTGCFLRSWGNLTSMTAVSMTTKLYLLNEKQAVLTKSSFIYSNHIMRKQLAK